MKHIITIWLLIAVFSANAQFDEVVYETEWFLRNLRVNNSTRPIPLDKEVYPVTLDINPTTPIFSTAVCATLTMDIGVENEGIFTITSAINVTDEVCEVESNQTFQLTYFNFFVNFPDEEYIYSLTTNPDDASENLLFIVKPNGDETLYSSVPILDLLSQQLQAVILYPNPASNFINVMQTNGERLYYKIYNAQGKIIHPLTEVSNQSIPLKNLKSGLYFIVLEDNFGNKKIVKVVKREK